MKVYVTFSIVSFYIVCALFPAVVIYSLAARINYLPFLTALIIALLIAPLTFIACKNCGEKIIQSRYLKTLFGVSIMPLKIADRCPKCGKSPFKHFV